MMLRDLIERLADKEHASWARWQEYLHGLGQRRYVPMEGLESILALPIERIEHWERQIATPYADLPEHSKESDRKEVREILPDIYEYGRAFLANGIEMGYLPPVSIKAWNEQFEREGVHVW